MQPHRLERRTLSLLFAALAVVLQTLPLSTSRAFAAGTELVMFDEPGCPWCVRWRREVGVAYPNSAEGKRAPLRVIDISKARSSGIALSAPVRGTPTFVLVDGGREVGRISGYPGPDFFWSLLEGLLKKLGPETPAGNSTGRRAALATAVR